MSRDVAFEARFASRYAEAKAYSATLEGPSLAERLAALPASERDALLAGLSRSERAALAYSWPFWSRPKQRPPFGEYRHLLWLGGRGMGKNRSGSERLREHIMRGARSLLIAGPTHREVLRNMVGGKAKNGSGLLDVFPPDERARIEVKEQKGEIHFPGGAIVYFASDESPELRGGGYEIAWLDELCKWRHAERLWSNIEFSMRVRGAVAPEVIITTTPKPTRFLRELVADPDTLTIVGRSDENAANLDHRFIARLEAKFGGTRIGRQERDGELLEDVDGALFSASVLDAARVDVAPDLVRVVVAIDPSIATGRDNDATGLLAMGIDAAGDVYVLEDASAKMAPEAWGAAALRLYDRYRADAFVAERNRGGDLVRANLNASLRQVKGAHATAKIIEVWATRGKHIRAEPVATLAEQGRLHLVGDLAALVDELTTWSPSTPGPSPNRLDALVWGAFDLARLSEEEAPAAAPDPALAFRGLERMAAELQTKPAPTRSSPLSALLAPVSRGRRI